MSGDASISQLTSAELEALRGAAVWYARYHERDIAAHAGDGSALAVVEREEYCALIAGLRKLGVRLPLPAGLAAADLRAA